VAVPVRPWYGARFGTTFRQLFLEAITSMSKPHRTLKKANHGSRPANSKARKAKRKHIKT
jgi:hypothetical protein